MNEYQKFSPLTELQVTELFASNGPNILQEGVKETILQKILRLLISPLVLFLIVVAIFSLTTSEIEDAVFIFVVIIINTLVGYLQERRAERAIASLKNALADKAKVIRANKGISTINSSELVPGDIVMLDTGDKVPADGILLETKSLTINESLLTGESLPVEKAEKENNELFMSTLVASGRAIMRVTATGSKTRIGKVSTEVSQKSRDTSPIEKKLSDLTKIVIFMIIILFLGLIFISLMRQDDIASLFSSFVAFAISSTPESLPVILLITLSVGAYRMEKQNVILRNLPSTATLSSVDVICTDKTGTLTEGKLNLTGIYHFNKGILVSSEDNDLELLKLAGLCNSASSHADGYVGDLLDIAILEDLEKLKCDVTALRKDNELLSEIPFDSHYKYHATLHKDPTANEKNLVILKGSVEAILELCKDMSEDHKKEVLSMQDSQANLGFKVIAIAKGHTKHDALSANHLPKLQFTGLMVFSDIIRKDVPAVIKNILQSGIKIIMITGDQINAARTIAKHLNIFSGNKLVVNALNKNTFHEALLSTDKHADIENLAVVARATPGHKLELVEMLRARGNVVAMTGDGVNDAPALVRADIGIAMGKGGTDVARESADMVLVDNRFTSIVAGIEEARVVFENIRKVITYLFSTAIGETTLIVASLLAGFVLPLTATQILFINLATDGALDVALAGEQKEKNVIRFSPSRYKEAILSKALSLKVIIQGALLGASAVWLHQVYLAAEDITYIRSAMVVYLTIAQWFMAFSARTNATSIFKVGIFSNKFIWLVILSSFLAICFFIYTAPGQQFLKTTSVNSDIWIFAFGFGILYVFVNELRKKMGVLV